MDGDHASRSELTATVADRERLRAGGLGRGLTAVGFTTADPPATWDAYEAWVSDGFHGQMTYLADHVPLKRSLEAVLPGARSVIAVALNYFQPNEPVIGQPRIATYALGGDYHRVLRGHLRGLARELAERFPGARTRITVDSAPVLEREFAHRAGLGWFGKNTMLIDSRRGSWFVIGLLITDVEFPPDAPSLGGCGSCRACIDACPTGAIQFHRGRWQVVGHRCISYLTIEHRGEIAPELATQVGDWTFGCDVCQSVCPFNQPRESQPERAPVTPEPDFLARRQWPDLLTLAQWNESAWHAATAGSPVRRAGVDGIRRNASINLANAASDSFQQDGGGLAAADAGSGDGVIPAASDELEGGRED